MRLVLIVFLAFGVLASGVAAAQSVPTPVSARVMDLKQRGQDVELTLAAGSRDGVKTSWRGELVDDQGRPLPGTQFQVLRVEARTTVVRVPRATVDALNATAKRARLTP